MGTGVSLALTALPSAARVRALPGSCVCFPLRHGHCHLSIGTSGSQAKLVQLGFQLVWGSETGREGSWAPCPGVPLQALSN